MNDKITKLIQKGELSREKEQIHEAFAYLTEAMVEAAKIGDYTGVCECLAHRLVVYLHLWQQTEKKIFLDLTRMDARQGLAICETYRIDDSVRGTFHLRLGTYYREKGDLENAAEEYRKAVKLVEKGKDKIKYAEFLGHYAEIVLLNGDKKGLGYFGRAIELVEKAKGVRPFHKLIILSGMYGRMARAHFHNKEKLEGKTALAKATELAKELAIKHKMKVRLKQIQKISKEYDS